MFFQAFAALAALPVIWTVWSIISLVRNVMLVRKTGLPYVINPICHGNALWMVFHKMVVPIFRLVPFGNGNFTRFDWRGWEFKDKFKAHEELGDAFFLVTPADVLLLVCDPDAIAEIFKKKFDFVRPLWIFEMTNCFGESILNVPDKEWQKHRKVTATAFNDRNNELVWDESVRQGQDMVRYWAAQDAVASTADDTRTLSLNVLSAAGFGKSYPFKGDDFVQGSQDDYKKSLQVILENLLILFALGKKNLSKPWMPKKVAEVHKAILSFQTYMTKAYESEKNSLSEPKRGQANLMSSLVRASQDQGKADGLTESQIYGNRYDYANEDCVQVFVFNFAGHESTASTLTFAIYLLSTNPEAQEWMYEEIQHVFGDLPCQEWKYEQYSKLKRCLAVIYEAARLYPPSPLAKSTEHPAELTISGQKYVIPGGIVVLPNHIAVQCHPKYWGPDSMDWKPSRFIESPQPGSLDAESFKAPRKGQYLAWSEGHQNCLGKKFAHVELVAALATLFKDWRVSPKARDGESPDDARKRVLKQIQEDTDLIVLLQMLHPEKAPLVWTRR